MVGGSANEANQANSHDPISPADTRWDHIGNLHHSPQCHTSKWREVLHLVCGGGIFWSTSNRLERSEVASRRSPYTELELRAGQAIVLPYIFYS